MLKPGFKTCVVYLTSHQPDVKMAFQKFGLPFQSCWIHDVIRIHTRHQRGGAGLKTEIQCGHQARAAGGKKQYISTARGKGPQEFR